jgi:hypothetical protein
MKRISPSFRPTLRWAIFHVALVIFLCDLIAAIWPAFDHIWQAVARVGVALGVTLAAAFEYLEHLEAVKEQRRLAEFHGRLKVKGGANNDPEMPDGEGVYLAEFNGHSLLPPDSPYRDGRNPRRPGPGPDGIPARPYQGTTFGPFSAGDGGLFAFASIAQARRWFDRPQDVNRWAAKGLRLSAYHRSRVHRPMVTDHQAVFMPGDIRPRPTLSLPASSLYTLEPDTLEAQAKEAFKHARV